MSYLVLLCLLVHQSVGYSIKMQGKVEVGQELAVIFQDLFDQYLQNSKGQTEIDMSKLVKAVNDFVVPEPPPQTYIESQEYKKGKKQIRREDGKVKKDIKKERHETKSRGEKNKTKFEEKEKAKDHKPEVMNEKLPREKTFLEEIAGKQEKVHVYGKHTEDKRDLPFNNINV